MACFVASVVLVKLGFDENNIYKFWGGVFLSPILLIYNYFVLTADIKVKNIEYYPVSYYANPEEKDPKKIPYFKIKDSSDDSTEVVLLSERNLEIPSDSKEEEYNVKITKYEPFYYLIYIDIKDKYEIELKTK
jgi:hypothetical protein